MNGSEKLTTFRQYTIIQQLRVSAGQSDIYAVRKTDGGDDQPYLLKIYGHGAKVPEQILGQIMALGGDHSENLIRMYDCGFDEDAGRYFEVQEFIRYGSLNRLIAAMNEGNRDFVMKSVVEQIMNGLKILHDNNILHLDLKPSNILIKSDKPFKIVLTDFGLSSVLDRETSWVQSQVKGTNNYQAPEVYLGSYHKKTDYWAFGIIIYELLLGENPFKGKKPPEVMNIVTNQKIEISDKIDKKYISLLKGLLTKEVTSRWGWEEVSKWLAGEIVESEPETRYQKSFKFRKKEYFSLKDLVAAFIENQENWEDGLWHLNKGHIEKWIEGNEDYDNSREFEKLIKSSNEDGNLALLKIIYNFNNKLPFALFGKQIDIKSIGLFIENILKPKNNESEKTIIEYLIKGELTKYYDQYLNIVGLKDDNFKVFLDIIYKQFFTLPRRKSSSQQIYDESEESKKTKLEAIVKIINILNSNNIPQKYCINFEAKFKYAIYDILLNIDSFHIILGTSKDSSNKENRDAWKKKFGSIQLKYMQVKDIPVEKLNDSQKLIFIEFEFAQKLRDIIDAERERKIDENYNISKETINLKSEYHKVIGIDLGTTYSTVSVFDNTKNTVVIIPNNYGKNTTPSVVSLDKNNKILVGDQAKRNIPFKPDGTIVEVKRLMGKSNKCYKNAHGNTLPLPAYVVPGPPDASMKVKFLGCECEPQLISAIIIDYLKKAAEKFIGCPIYDAVITVPAYFTEAQRKAIEDAARIAQINPRLLINEPTAAAIAYKLEQFKESGEKKTYLIYHLGGGTFDVSIITVDEGQISVVRTSGNDHLGGGDFDNAMTEWAINEIKRTEDIDFSSNKSVREKIKAACEQTKRDLSMIELTSIDIAIPELTASIDITRAQFEQMIKHYLDETIKGIDEALKSAYNEATINDLDMVILAGGSSRIPKVKEMIKQKLMKDKDIDEAKANEMIKADLNPDEIVAMGAARMATTIQPMDKFEGEVVETESGVSSGAIELRHTVGIGVMCDPSTGSDYEILFSKNTKLPCSITKKSYTNAIDYQSTVEITIYQGESSHCIYNIKLGTIVIPLEPRLRGEHSFDIIFSIDFNELLSITVLHMKAGQIVQKLESKINCGTQKLSDDEIIKRQSEMAAALMTGTMPAGRAAPVSTLLPISSMDRQPFDVKIPEEYKIIYEQAVIKMNNSSGEKQAMISKAVNEFKLALLIQDPELIKTKGNALIQAAFG